MGRSRPGGRTARTTTAVFAAVEALLGEKPPGAISIAEVAERAGVAATSLYRRWGDLPTLLIEVAVDRLMTDWPLPDTGSLEGDLNIWATAIAASLSSREGSLFFRVYVATAPSANEPSERRTAAVMRRIEQIAAMLDRARSRGEPAPTVLEVTDHLLAPLYMRALFGIPADESVAHGLVARLLGDATGGPA
jgi:AcrR family transcriptional regulator